MRFTGVRTNAPQGTGKGINICNQPPGTGKGLLCWNAYLFTLGNDPNLTPDVTTIKATCLAGCLLFHLFRMIGGGHTIKTAVEAPYHDF